MLRKSLIWVLICILTLAGCVAQPNPKAHSGAKLRKSSADTGLRFRLSEGQEGKQQTRSLPKVKAAALSAAEMEPLLKRLAPIQARPQDQQDFALREGSKPPPRTARSLEQPFPPAQKDAPPVVVPKDLKLEVTQIAPRGPVEMAPHLTVTFNQPMVAVSSLEELAAQKVPVKLSPQPKGKWRWLGTQVLMFVPEVRLPMATSFQVEVPAGTVSANGNKLAAARQESFQTPPLQLIHYQPGGEPQKLNPTIFLKFNQRVDRQALARMVTLKSGDTPAFLRLATQEEVLLDERVAPMVEDLEKERWVAFKPVESLKPGQTYQVEVPSGTPSAEGPLLTSQAQSFSFSTYDPLKIVWKTDNTTPQQSWNVNFNNPLNAEKFDASMVKIAPELAQKRVRVYGDSLVISGRSKGRSQYQVTLAGNLTDQFEQTLGKPETFTIKVGPAPPSFRPPHQAFLVLGPKGPRAVTCQVVNHPQLKVEAWKVTPQDWGPYLSYLQKSRQNLKDSPEPPGQKVIDKVIETRLEADQEEDVEVDLLPALDNKLGQVVVRIEALPRPKDEWERRIYVGWVQSTQLGLDAVSDSNELVAWVNDLATGQSVAGAQVQLLGSAGEAVSSDSQGLARLALTGGAQLLVAQKGKDVAILPRSFSYWSSSSWSANRHSDEELWHVLDDRKLYRPGEKVSIKGWVRNQQYGPEGDITYSSMKSVAYSLYDSLGNEISKGEAKVGRLGGFNLEIALPKTINLGDTRVHLMGDNGHAYNHAFQVEEFRRPEFEVSTEANPGSSQIGSHSLLTAAASYFSGGPLANAKVNWNVSSSPTSYSPPGWEGYTFGTWTPWWSYDYWWMRDRNERSNATSQESSTDSKGKSTLQVDFLSVDPPQPHSLTAQATVQDVNRQTWTSSTTVLVHPASVYVGLKSARTFVEKGQPLEISLVVADLEGKAVAGRQVQVRSYRLDWDDNGKPVEVDESVQVLTSTSQASSLKIATRAGGTYQIEALVSDDDNRTNYSQLTAWVAGGKVPPSTTVEQESVALIPGKQEYQPGDTAEVLVQAPFAPAELLVTTRRNGLAKVERIKSQTGSATLKVALQELHIPGLTIQVDAVGSQDREGTKEKRPAYATGSLTLNVSKAQRKLAIAVQPAQPKLEPGATTNVTVEVRDYQGKPVQGEVTLIMVDEAVLALTGYNPADPLDSFCPLRSPDCEDTHLRQYLRLSSSQDVNNREPMKDGIMETEASGGELPPMPAGAPQEEMRSQEAPMAKLAAPSRSRGENKKQQAPIRVRTNFTPLALFAPALMTDAQGRATTQVKLPDNLTRYRLIALASGGVKQFGKGESSLVARQPLMLRPSAPRFLNFGDRFELPCVVQNQSDSAMEVSLVCRASNAKLGDQGQAAGYRFKVAANDRVELRFPCSTEQAGTARFQFAATAGESQDAAEVSLPVWTPATTEAFATYGILDEGATRQAIQKPKDVWPQFGGLTVTTSSTALAELTDAFLYLTSYPFDCSEQVASRMLAAAALKDVLEAFQAPGMASKAELNQAMARDLERLRGLQNDNGGWDYWVRNKPSVPYLSVHVAHSLVRVKSKGFEVHPEMLQRALSHLQDIESHIPSEYSESCKRMIRAYALYVLHLADQSNPSKARALARETGLDKLGMETMGWLLPTLAKDPQSKATCTEIYRYLDNHSTQTASTAQFTSGYADQGYLVLYSDRRDDGLLLEALITTQPKHPLIPKLVRGLLDHRKGGHWANTQENCWVLLALDKYFQQYESVTPNFVARLWLGEDFAGEQSFRGRDKDEKVLRVPMAQVKGPLTVAKEGPGRLYYRIGLNYSPKDLKQEAADYGFHVQREYESVDDNRDVRREKDGRWHIKSGSRVKVTVTMHAPSRRYHVALVDPLPAGLEALNPSLLGSDTPGDKDRWWHWYQHQNLRDERVEAFTQLLWEGVYTYSYVARATTPGTFVVPPSKAEEMYHPETFGRSASDIVVVED